MRPFARELRVADHLRERLADIIRTEMRDPRVRMISINDVRVSRDLSTADVYFSALGVDSTEEQRTLEDVLNHAAGFLRTALSRESTLRTMPRPRFHFDRVWAEGGRMDALIQRAVSEDLSHHRGDEQP
jgi:ribosome-binding factor A